MLKATVSGSFHRHMPAIYAAVMELREQRVGVLSPSDPRVVDHLGAFLFVASDRLRSIKLVQDRHLAAIKESDFLWVVCPDGYTGASTCLEIGTATAANVPIFATAPVLDITISQYVRQVTGIPDAVKMVSNRSQTVAAKMLLLDPDYAIDRSIEALDELRPALTAKVGDGRGHAERQYKHTRELLLSTFGS